VYNKKTKTLEYRATKDQDLLSDVQPDLVPILNVDIWEHAFYLDYKNVKADFVKEIWKVVDWK
jgi:Fe-Mn family superoxide dismutase